MSLPKGGKAISPNCGVSLCSVYSDLPKAAKPCKFLAAFGIFLLPRTPINAAFRTSSFPLAAALPHFASQNARLRRPRTIPRQQLTISGSRLCRPDTMSSVNARRPANSRRLLVSFCCPAPRLTPRFARAASLLLRLARILLRKMPGFAALAQHK